MSVHTTVGKVSPTTLLKREDWAGLGEYYRHRPDNLSATPDNVQHIVLFAISYLRQGEVEAGLSLLSDAVLRAHNSRALLRRWVISPGVESHLMLSFQVVNRLLAAGVCQVQDVLLVARGLIKGQSIAMAADLVARARDVFPQDSHLFALGLRCLVLSGNAHQALTQVRAQAVIRGQSPEVMATCLYYLHQRGLHDDKALAFSLIQRLDTDTLASATLRVDILLSVGQAKQAILAGESALAAGIDGATLRRSLGQAYYQASHSRESKHRAVEHLRQAVVFNPDNLRAATLYADMLVRTGQNAESIPLLARWLDTHPDLAYVRALYARALRQQGQYSAASAEFLRLAQAQGATSKWHRYAAAALLQAGEKEEAERLFSRYIEARRAPMAGTFEEGLQGLDAHIDQVNLPVARLDWAWEVGGKHSGLTRGEWERRAKWGHLADNFLLDWLECRTEQADEPMYQLGNIGQVEQFFHRLQLKERGCIIVTGHLGAMYAGPMLMSLLNMNSKWVASTPGVLKGGYGERLISVSDKSESEVVRACVQTLHSGQSIAVAIDGSLSLAAPTIEFLGQQVTYSTFCSRLAYKMHLPTVFCVPVWREGHIHFVLEKMVDPLKVESLSAFMERWKGNYLACVTRILESAPENLRLSGGLWRHIVVKDRSPR